MAFEVAMTTSALSQGVNPVLILILASSAISTLLLAALIFFFFRWLERGTQSKLRISVCMYCGSRSLNVSPIKDTAGHETALCYCNNCKRYFSLEIPPQ